jgi:CPA2 family monovalent cation:H+ antiporter-2
MTFWAGASADVALVFIEIGAVALVLAILARVAGRLGITAIPFYLLAGLAVGEGGIFPLDVSSEFISQAAEIGGLLLLLVLGLEYSADELRQGSRAGGLVGTVDAGVNFTPGFAAGLLLGWDVTTHSSWEGCAGSAPPEWSRKCSTTSTASGTGRRPPS